MAKGKNRQDFNISNQGEIQNLYKDLPDEYYNTVSRDTLKGIGQPVAKAIKTFIGSHKRSGLLKKSIKTKLKTYPARGKTKKKISILLAGPDRDTIGDYKGKRAWPNKYAHLVDRGTKPHSQPKNKSTHPGSKASNFMDKGWRSVKGYVVGTAVASAKKSLDKVLAKLKRK